MLDLKNKNALVFGVASESSIAWGVAKTLHAAGAHIHLGYQQRFRSRLLQLLKGGDIPIASYERCDVTVPSEIDEFFSQLPDQIDLLVHSIAHVNPETFAMRINEVAEEDFTAALTTSAYSLLPLARACRKKMRAGGSIVAMSYLGGQRVVPNYKVMGIAKAGLEATVRELANDLGPDGIRVNAISAGPIKTLSSAAVSGFEQMLDAYARVSPMRRTVTQEDVGNLAVFLGSDMARNITGQTLFVDAGFSILGMATLPV